MIYYHKMGTPQSGGGGGDGSKANPWYWYEKTSGLSINLDNTSTGGADNGRLYIRVKLQAGTTYWIGQTPPDDVDGKIWLYDENGTELAVGDTDDYEEIGGVGCTDYFQYTPATTGIYIIGAGSYSSDVGTYKVAISAAPLEDPVPSSQTIIPTSGGFNDWGRPIKYRSARAAKCNKEL